MEELSQDADGGGLAVKVEEVEDENLTGMAALDADEEDEEALPHSEILDIFEEGLAQLVQDPLLCDLPIQVTLEEVNSQIALEYGQAMTVRVLKADGEIMLVVQNATVLDLKKAIRRFMELKQQREGASTMTSSDSELKKISTELEHVSLKRQELVERKKIHCIFQELRNRAEHRQTEEVVSKQHDIDGIDDKLKPLTERTAELQQSLESILNAKKNKSEKGKSTFTVSHTSSQTTGVPGFNIFSVEAPPTIPEVSYTSSQTTVVPGCDIFYVEAPPAIPAPSVILDVEKLPPCPCKTQCPECRQFITTETFTSVSSVTWLSQFKCISCESRKSEEKTPTGADMSKGLAPSAATDRVRSSQSILSTLVLFKLKAEGNVFSLKSPSMVTTFECSSSISFSVCDSL
ncbi:hypothetical protein FQN60_003977 [Etheostoma spectabile]|uniref:SNRNP25 ubiquitin-like domain-containing protein n=1 Tax=Etheostoma spectabile TaxID=54343 RepID=A0A5J5CWN1_9PERO|nr:hypothetical protein FQN60_003977 [Etheostoma spectabile]